MQIHSNAYRNPGQLPEGAVLVVGAGSSGVQIADELLRAGKRVYLSVGPHDRPPRAYRERDYCWWLGVLGKWDLEAPAPNTEHVTIAVSGVDGGQTIDFRRLAAAGMTLVGLTRSSYKDGALTFAADLAAESWRAATPTTCRCWTRPTPMSPRNGLDLPEEPEAREIGPDPPCVTNPILELNLAKAGVTSIIWATGYSVDYSWLDVDAFDASGKPKHQRGVSIEPGHLFPGASVAVAPGFELHLGRLARRQILGGPDRRAAEIPRLRSKLPSGRKRSLSGKPPLLIRDRTNQWVRLRFFAPRISGNKQIV